MKILHVYTYPTGLVVVVTDDHTQPVLYRLPNVRWVEPMGDTLSQQVELEQLYQDYIKLPIDVSIDGYVQQLIEHYDRFWKWARHTDTGYSCAAFEYVWRQFVKTMTMTGGQRGAGMDLMRGVYVAHEFALRAEEAGGEPVDNKLFLWVETSLQKYLVHCMKSQ